MNSTLSCVLLLLLTKSFETSAYIFFKPLFFLNPNPPPLSVLFKNEGVNREGSPSLSPSIPFILNPLQKTLKFTLTQLDLASTNYVTSKTLSSYDLYVSPSTDLSCSIKSLKLPKPSRIRIDGSLTIDGAAIDSADLFGASTITVSEKGSLKLKGPLKCSRLVVEGTVSTSLGVVCESLKVGPVGHVKGSVRCTEGEVAEGGRVDTLQMGKVGVIDDGDDEKEFEEYFDDVLSEIVEEESVRFANEDPVPVPIPELVSTFNIDEEYEEDITTPPAPAPVPEPDPEPEEGFPFLQPQAVDQPTPPLATPAIPPPPPPPPPTPTPTPAQKFPAATKFDSFGNPLISTVELRQEPAPPKTKRWLPPTTPKPVRLQEPPPSSPIPSDDNPMLKRGTVTLRDNFDQPLVGSASSSHVNALKLNRIMLQEDRQMINEHLGIVDPGEKVDAVVGEVDRPVGEGGYDFREAAGITDKILGKKRSEKAQAPPSTSLTEEAGEKEKLFEEAKAIGKKKRRNIFKKF
ncbi:hypothetical protein TrST_g5995 [Triparma strigata]|uniref:Uncharacterized protein n=1 Tax=Triparma strigata TaxID=1606541 RepID=A0A9W7BGS8_9STRA|nr:hypothetical protein TrST_g5995 [Triparma strigata]